MGAHQDKARAFLRTAQQYHLGALPTESRHPLTYQLATMAKEDLVTALRLLKQIDADAVAKVIEAEGPIAALAKAIANTFADGGRVYLYGCGATGRLSLSLDYLWRSLHPNQKANQVLGFMSGGDLALVRSIENFEDHPEYGARQLQEIGFRSGDLLISCTEGGETPSVIGATEEACKISSRDPYFLYCNPNEILHKQVERSRRVLENPRIQKIPIFVGPMSLSGSTRLQASTVLMLAVGTALLPATEHLPKAAHLLEALQALDTSFLESFIRTEAEIYASGGFVLYETDHYGMTIITDTTERSPTFSLTPFENFVDGDKNPSLCYLRIPSAADSKDSWRKLLLRDPIALEWEELRAVASEKRLYGFDFSANFQKYRQELLAGREQHSFQVLREGGHLVLRLKNLRHEIDVSGLHPLCEHLLLKMIMNMHSTLVMGRLGRFESNVMTWVKPSNGKLIDRAIRYVQYLLLHESIAGFSYEDIAYQCFLEMEDLRADESVVLKTFKALKNRKLN